MGLTVRNYNGNIRSKDVIQTRVMYQGTKLVGRIGLYQLMMILKENKETIRHHCKVNLNL